jgi:hypothetical protein
MARPWIFSPPLLGLQLAEAFALAMRSINALIQRSFWTIPKGF